MLDAIGYPFVWRALVVGILVSACAALLGVVMVLKRYSMIGDGLSHVGFGALAVAMAFNFAPLAVSIPVVVLSAFFLLRISESSRIKGDAAVALLSSSALAIGVIVSSVSKGMNMDVFNFMFGSILALSNTDVYISLGLSIAVLVLYILMYNRVFALAFDENFAKASGMKTGLLNMAVAFLTAITIVLGMRIMGTLLISSLIIFPALTSMRLFSSFKRVIICSVIVSIICFLIGMIVSFAFSLPTGASIVVVSLVFFAAASLFRIGIKAV